jgi:hypothetical protein
MEVRMATKRNDGNEVTDMEAVDAAFVTSPQTPVDPEIEEEFHSVDAMARSGGERLARKLAEHHSQSPALTAGDIDAAWDRSDVGEESPGGSVATPDQGVVDEIGAALGVTFEDDEPVDTPGKLGRRDRKRWELDPVSAEDFPDHR